MFRCPAHHQSCQLPSSLDVPALGSSSSCSFKKIPSPLFNVEPSTMHALRELILYCRGISWHWLAFPCFLTYMDWPSQSPHVAFSSIPGIYYLSVVLKFLAQHKSLLLLVTSLSSNACGFSFYAIASLFMVDVFLWLALVSLFNVTGLVLSEMRVESIFCALEWIKAPRACECLLYFLRWLPNDFFFIQSMSLFANGGGLLYVCWRVHLRQVASFFCLSYELLLFLHKSVPFCMWPPF